MINGSCRLSFDVDDFVVVKTDALTTVVSMLSSVELESSYVNVRSVFCRAEFETIV